LREGHGQELIPTGKVSDAMVAAIAIYTATELVVRKMLYELSENSLTLVHTDPPDDVLSGR